MDRYTQPDFERAALLSIDVQRDVLDGPLSFASPAAMLANLARTADAFRVAGRPIVHVARLYLPDGSNADLCRRAVLERGEGALVAGTPGSALVADLLPEGRPSELDTQRLLGGRMQHLASAETVMYKPRWGAFYDTGLLAHLRVHAVTTVVVIGCNFPNCPRATIVEASERDLRVVAVIDALSRFTDRDAVELDDLGVAVMTAAEVAEHLNARRAPAITGAR